VEESAALVAVAALGDDLRRGLYRFVRRQGRPVTREEAAAALRISVKLAAFHLDKLVDRGLLRADHAVPPEVRRRVGRAPKRYQPTDVQVSLSVPERRYDLLGEILVDAVAQAVEGRSAADTARDIARQRGGQVGAQARLQRRLGRPGPERTIAVTEELLEGGGFEPAPDDVGGLLLRNCPFHTLVERAPALVCSINLAYVDGLLRGLGNDTVRTLLRPQAGLCCVRVRPPER